MEFMITLLISLPSSVTFQPAWELIQMFQRLTAPTERLQSVMEKEQMEFQILAALHHFHNAMEPMDIQELTA